MKMPEIVFLTWWLREVTLLNALKSAMDEEH